MPDSPIPVVLGSQSPRRQALLRQIGVEPRIRPADIDESMLDGETALAYVERMAIEKAQATQARAVPSNLAEPDLQEATGVANEVVLAADTIVIKDDDVLGKPQDKNDYERMMSLLSGTSHQVLTAVCCLSRYHQSTAVSSTEVTFCSLEPVLIERYWDSGEPRGKAGGYAIQGLGAVFITHINGSYSGVMGLPLFETSALLSEAYARIHNEN